MHQTGVKVPGNDVQNFIEACRELKDRKNAASHDAVRLLTDAHPSSVQQAGASVQRPPQPLLGLPSGSAGPSTGHANGASTSQAAFAMLADGAGPSQQSNYNALVTLPRSDGSGTSQQADALMVQQADGPSTSQQCTALVPFPVVVDGAGATQPSTALVARPADAAGTSQQDNAVVPLPNTRRSGRLARKRGKPDTPEESADTACTALVPVPKDGAGAGPSQGEDAGNEGSACENDDDDGHSDEVETEPQGGKGKGKKGSKKQKQARQAQQKRTKLDPSLEAEFALAMLENTSLREIVDLLKISRADLPAMSAEEARHLLAASADPLAEAHAKRAAELQSIAEARQESRADDATLMRVARFLEVQNGTNLELVSQPLARLITDDMHDRARELEKQNAETCDIQLRGKKRKPNSIQLTCAVHLTHFFCFCCFSVLRVC